MSAAATVFALSALSTTAASSASFLLSDGDMIEGAIANFGGRYVVVESKNGDFFIVERSKIASVSVIGESGSVVGALAGWSEDGFVIDADNGTVEVREVAVAAGSAVEAALSPDAETIPVREAETAAPAASEAGPEASSEASAAIDPTVASEPPETAAQAEPTENAAAETETQTEPAPEVESATNPEEAPASSETETAATSTAPTTDATTGVAEASRPASRPQTEGAMSAEPDALVISTDSPEAEREVDDRIKILTKAPDGETGVASVDQTASPPRLTSSDSRPTSPGTPALSIPTMATPQLSVSDSAEPEETPEQAAAAQPEQSDETDGTGEEVASADAVETAPSGKQAPNVGQIEDQSQPPTADEAPGEDAIDVPGRGSSARAEASDQSSEGAPPAAEASAAEDGGVVVAASDGPPSSEASPLEEGELIAVDATEPQPEPEETIVAVDSVAIGDPRATATQASGSASPVEVGSETRASLAGDGTPPAEMLFNLRGEYRWGVIGAPEGSEGRLSCAELGRVATSPLPFSKGRLDPGALSIEIGPDAPEQIAKAVSAAFLGLDPKTLDPTIAAAPGETTAFFLEPKSQRLIRPERIVGFRVDKPGELLDSGQADVAFVGGAPPPGSLEAGRARLVAFDALAFVGHPEVAQGPISGADLAGLLGGKLSDWSMIDPRRVGPTLMVLPPDGALSLNGALEFSGARRARPASARRIERAADRATAARVTKGAMALTLWSALDGAPPLAIGAAAPGVAPSLDTIRSGAYPLAWPIYAVIPEDPAHASSALLLDFLSGPAGQRAIYDAGLAPVAACDPSTCDLSAPGLEAARERLTERLQTRIGYLEMGGAEAVSGSPIASFSAPSAPAAPVQPLIEQIAQFVSDVRPGDRILIDASQIVARGGPTPGGDQASARTRASVAIVRAEAVALALRCAGVRVERVTLDPSPLTNGDNGAGSSVVLELLPLQQ